MLRLDYMGTPKTGQFFSLNVNSTARPAKTQWLINGNLEREFLCPDPPCYQQLFIHRDWDGGELRIIAMDQDDMKELRFRIVGNDLNNQQVFARA